MLAMYAILHARTGSERAAALSAYEAAHPTPAAIQGAGATITHPQAKSSGFSDDDDGAQDLDDILDGIEEEEEDSDAKEQKPRMEDAEDAWKKIEASSVGSIFAASGEDLAPGRPTPGPLLLS